MLSFLGDDKEDVCKPRNIEPSRKVVLYEVLKGFSKLGIIVAYAYLCDRYGTVMLGTACAIFEDLWLELNIDSLI